MDTVVVLIVTRIRTVCAFTAIFTSLDRFCIAVIRFVFVDIDKLNPTLHNALPLY
jgi:hypothetical protein